VTAPEAPVDLSVTISPLETKVLRALREEAGASAGRLEEELVRSTGEGPDSVRGSLERLRSKRLVVLEERSQDVLALTERGREVRERGLPERRLVEALKGGPKAKADLLTQGFSEEELSAAVGQLRRIDKVTPGATLSLASEVPAELPDERLLRQVAEGTRPEDAEGVSRLVRRGLIVKDPRRTRLWRPSPEGSALPLPAPGGESLGALTPALLRSGAWVGANFRPYDVRAEVPHVLGARTHLYQEWLRSVEEVLVGLGFEEYRTPLVEQEFYNNDLLFMPQEHPARSMQDMFFLEGVEGKDPPSRLLKPVAAVHEGRAPPRSKVPLSAGWQTPYRNEIARRVILRSQTTATSMRYLATRPKAPFRMYCLDSVFRYDALDATHLIQFDQCEGVMGKRGTNFRHLLGLLTQFAHAIGIREVRFQPTYFPFTEPSVQGFVKHPKLGWVEMMPGGMFRPEVLKPLGIRVPVAAWGLGISRLAMVALGLSDIRDLYLDDLTRLSSARI
jgi:phenylalanyl-tRNA synthetase alpha chain